MGTGSGALPAFGGNVDGPLPATFSAADRACGWWYPAASMLAHQDTESAAGLTYQRGAMGHDGYQQSPPCTTVTLQPQGTGYSFRKGGYYLPGASAVTWADQSAFAGAHSDIQHPGVVWPVAGASR